MVGAAGAQELKAGILVPGGQRLRWAKPRQGGRAATVGTERRRPRRRWWALRVLENAWGGNYQVPQRARGRLFVLWMERRHRFVQEKRCPP